MDLGLAVRRKKRAHNQKIFLATFALTANLTTAAAAAGIPRTTVYKWQEEDEQFCAALNEAREQAYDRLEQEALRRAVEGTQRKRPIIVGREVVDYEIITEYSDRLLEMLLKAARPEKYRERQSIEHSGSDGGPIVIDVAEQRSALASRIASLTERTGPPALASGTD